MSLINNDTYFYQLKYSLPVRKIMLPAKIFFERILQQNIKTTVLPEP